MFDRLDTVFDSEFLNFKSGLGRIVILFFVGSSRVMQVSRTNGSC